MSTTITALALQLASVLLPLIGVNVGSDALTQAVSTFVVIGTGVYLWYKRVSLGDVNIVGVRQK